MKKALIIVAIVIATVVTIGYFWYRKQTPSNKVEQKAYDVMLTQILSHSVPEITIAQLASSPEKYTLLDSRTAEEYKTSHIANAIFIGENADQLDSTALQKIPTDKPIVTYCSVGLRSEKAAEQLKKKGFENVSNLYGGIFEWSNQPLPLVNSEGNPTDTIHGYNMIWAKWITAGKIVLN